ncbi:MAG: carboxypeptidase-like regulatory domain-containing protein, partial [Nitrospiria bacterium]
MRTVFRNRLISMSSAMILALSILLPTAAAADPPANDSFLGPTSITGLPFQDTPDISSATSEVVDRGVCQSAKTIWYELTLTDAIPIAIDTTGTSFPTDIAVFNGIAPVPVVVSCGTTSTRFFTPTATGRYLLRVGTRTLDPVGLLHLSVYALGSVSGRVIDQDGNPLQDKEVMIFDAEDEWSYDWAYSDSEGRYSFSQLARGNYKLFF